MLSYTPCFSEGKLSAFIECGIPTSVSSAPAGTWASILTLLDSLNNSWINYSLQKYVYLLYPSLGGGVTGNYICVWSLKTLLYTYVVLRVSIRRKGFSAN